MRTVLLAAIVLVFSGSVAIADFSGQVVSVADGDTITVLRNGSEQVKVRLDGIDAPEKGQPFGDAAKKATSAACFGKVVNVVERGSDRYGRTIGVIEVGEQNLNLELVRSGHAWWYRQYAPTNTALAEAEKAAREARRAACGVTTAPCRLGIGGRASANRRRQWRPIRARPLTGSTTTRVSVTGRAAGTSARVTAGLALLTKGCRARFAGGDSWKGAK